MKKVISALLAAALAFSALLTLAGCSSDGDYPVEVANLTIKEEPKNIVVLSAKTADIISCIGYDVKMVGRSDEVNQEFLSIVPTVGSAQTPDIEKIKASEADLVFTDVEIDDDTLAALEENGIMVISMAAPQTVEEMKTAYITLGRILGGEITGAEKGVSAYEGLISDMEGATSGIDTGTIPKTVCYLYLDADGTLRTLNSGTYGDMLLSYTGAINTAVNITESKVDPRILKVANPDVIFYSDEETLENIKKETDLAALSAVKSKRTYMITTAEMELMGTTALLTLDKMISYIYPEAAKEVSSDKAGEAQNATAAEGETEPTIEETAPISLASTYKIELDGLSLKLEDENSNVKAVQQRLYDLGYVTDDENITGYYGEITQKAVKDFQKASGIEQTGVADEATLKALFMSDAKKAA